MKSTVFVLSLLLLAAIGIEGRAFSEKQDAAALRIYEAYMQNCVDLTDAELRDVCSKNKNIALNAFLNAARHGFPDDKADQEKIENDMVEKLIRAIPKKLMERLLRENPPEALDKFVREHPKNLMARFIRDHPARIAAIREHLNKHGNVNEHHPKNLKASQSKPHEEKAKSPVDSVLNAANFVGKKLEEAANTVYRGVVGN